MLIRYGSEFAVIDAFKILVQMICDGSTDFNITAEKGNNGIYLTCICKNPYHVGLLLGKSYTDNSGTRQNNPTKMALLKILKVISLRSGLGKVEISIEDENYKQRIGGNYGNRGDFRGGQGDTAGGQASARKN